MAVTDDVIKKAHENVEALESWGEEGFTEGLQEIHLRGMPTQVTPLRLLEHSKKTRGPMESRGFLLELGWLGKSGTRSKQVVLRFNPRSRPVSAEPTSVIYAFRDSGAEDLLMSERLPQDDLIAEEDPIAFLQKTLLRHAKKDEFCRKLFDAYWKDLALAQTEAETGAEAEAEEATDVK